MLISLKDFKLEANQPWNFKPQN